MAENLREYGFRKFLKAHGNMSNYFNLKIDHWYIRIEIFRAGLSVGNGRNLPTGTNVCRLAHGGWLPRTDKADPELGERRVGHGIQDLARVAPDNALSGQTRSAARPTHESVGVLRDGGRINIFTEDILGGEKVEADLKLTVRNIRIQWKEQRTL